MSIGFGDALSIVQLGLQLLKDIGAAGEQLEFMQLRMIGIEQQLDRAREIVTNKKDESRLERLSPAMYQHAKDAVDRLDTDVNKVNKILRAWLNKDLGFGGITLRYKKMSDFVNGVLKGGGDKLELLNKRLEEHQAVLDRCVRDMDHQGIKELLRRTSPALKAVSIQRPPRSPSPGPRPPTKIIFIDEFNTGRSVLAQSYLYLVQQWTTRTRNAFALTKISSAGLLVSHRSAYIEQITTLRSIASNRIRPGNQPSNPTAINALFNQPTFKYRYKPPIHDAALTRRSRGVPIDLFSGHDIIFVFTRIERGHLEELRERLNVTAPTWRNQNKRAQIQLLGDYGNHAQPQIREVEKKRRHFNANANANTNANTTIDNDDDDNDDDNEEETQTQEWQKVIGNIKTSVKAFLTQQTGWKVPRKEDAYLQGS